MKTILKFMAVAVVAVAALGFFVFPEKLELYAGTGKRIIQEKLDEAQGLDTKLALLETKVGGLDKEIVRLKTEVIRRQIDVEYLGDLVQEKEETHEKLRLAMMRAHELLAGQESEFRINGHVYGRDEVARDAAEKLKIFKIQEETLKNLRSTLDTKTNTLGMARENVANAESIKAELTAKVRFLQADLEKYKAKEVFAETMQTRDLAAEFKTEIGKTQKMLAEFEQQLDVKDRILDERIRVNGEYVGGIDYTLAVTGGESDVVAEIEACLMGDGTPDF